MKFYIKISTIILGLLAAGTSFAASPYYVNNPALCPTDAFSQSCVGGLEVCGVNPSNVVSCYDTNTFSPPASQGSTSSNTATTTGGYYIDCYGYDTAAPYCNNNGSFYCMQNNSCNSLQKVTLCTAATWAASTCGACKAGYNDCDGNAVNGCSGATEHDGVACVTSLSLPGTWQNCVCVGSVLKLGSDSVSGATSVIQGGAASVFFINGLNVGIGSSAPNDTFSIANAGMAPAGSSATGHNYTSTYLSSDDYALANYGVVKTLIASATSTLSALWGGTLNGNIWNGAAGAGNVGIGTTAPGSKLSIADIGIANTPLTMIQVLNNIPYSTGNGVGGARVELGHGILHGYIEGGSVSETDSSSGYLAFGTRRPVNSIVEAMRISPTGNIGIGTTAPSEKLDISSAVAGGSTLKLYVDVGSYGDRGVIKFNGRTGGGGQANTAMAQILGGHTEVGNTNYLDFKVGAWNNNDTIGSTKMRINSAGNVGIGTTGPNDIFSISNSSGAAAPAGSDRTGHNYTSTYLSSDDYALANYGIVKSLISDATSSLPTITNYWSGTKNGTIWNGDAGAGNVGVGTTTPAYKLDVVGDMQVTTAGGAAFRVNTNSGLNFYSYLQPFIFQSNYTGPGLFSFRYGNTDRMTILQNGNVGIGVSAPASKLDLAGDFRITPSGSSGGILFTGVNATRLYSDASTAGLWMINSTSSRMFLGTTWNYDAQVTLDYTPGSVGAGAGRLVIGQTSKNAANYTHGITSLYTNGLERIRINVDGNVGIGTTTPEAKLDILGTVIVRNTTGIIMYDSAAAGGGRIYSSYNYANGEVDIRPLGSANPTVFSPNGGVIIGPQSGNPPANGLLVGGNVGIGTNAPNDIFSIGNSGSAPAGSSNTGHNYTNTYLSSDDYALANYGLVKTLISAATSSSALWGGTTGGNIWNLNSANIGVGTTAPSYKLDIQDTAAQMQIRSIIGTNYAMLRINNAGGDIWFGRESSVSGALLTGSTPFAAILSARGGYPIQFAVNNSPVMTLLNSGSVGIGTTSPSSVVNVSYKTLQIQSNSPTYGGAINLSSSDGDSVEIANYNTNLYLQNNGDTYFQDLAGTKRVMIQSTGNVGIGTTNPLQKLQISSGNSATFTPVDSAFSLVKNEEAYGLYVGVAGTGSVWMQSGTRNNVTKYNLLFNPNGGNVGIGITAPNDVFSIGNSGAAPAGSANTGHNYTSTYLSADDYALANYGIVKTLIASATSSLPAGVNFWGGTMNGNIWNGAAGAGNVGIGTTNPTGKLHIADDTQNALKIGSAAVSTIGETDDISYPGLKINPYNSTLHLGISGGADNSLFVWDAGTSYMKIQELGTYGVITENSTQPLALQTNGGNVGIGTTNPGGKLDILATKNITSFESSDYSGINSQLNISNSNTSIGHYYAMRMGANISGVGTFANGASLLGGTLITTAASNNFLRGLSLSVENHSTGTVSNMYGAYIDLRQTTTGTINNMYGLYIDNSASGGTISNKYGVYVNQGSLRNYFAGNVGIGTTAPNDLFSIGNAGSAPAGSANTGHNYTNTYLSTDDYALANYGIVKTLIAAATSTITSNTSWNKGGNSVSQIESIGTLSNHPLPFVVNSTEVMRLQANGSVSIGGGTSTTVRLHVASPQNAVALFTSTINAGLYSGFLGNGAAFSGEEFGLYETLSGIGLAVYDYQNSLIRFGDNIIIDTLNHVGINTTAPNDALSIGNAWASAPAGSSNTGHNYTNTYLSSDDYALANYGIVKTLIAAATSTMPTGANFWGGTLNGNIWNGAAGAGNVGIGTTNPTAPFSVVSSLDVDTFTLTNQALSANIGFVLRLPLSTGTNDGKAFGFYAGNESWTRGLFYSDGAYGIGPGNATRDVFLRRYSANNLMIDSNKAGGAANLLVTGNVGIGTTTTLSKLDVQSNTGKQANFFGYSEVSSVSKAYNYNGSIMLGNVAAYQGIIDYFGASTPATLTIKNTYSVATTNSRINFDIGANNIMSVQGSGNIGIGTLSPGGKLHILNATSTPYKALVLDNDSATNGSGAIIHFVSSTDENVGAQIAGGRENTGGTSYLKFTNYLDGTGFVERMRISGAGNVGIGTTVPNDIFSIGNAGSAPAGSSNTGHNFTNTYLTNDDYALTNYGLVKSMISATGGLAVYSTSTPATYAGNVGSYTAANALCSAVVTGAHVCTSEEMLNTINKGQAGNVPINSMLWINNGPPAFTANANDCIGWTSNASNSYSAQWNRPTGYADGFGSLNNCNIPRKFACCK